MDNIETVQVLDGACQIEQHTAGIPLCVFVGRGDGIKKITALQKEFYECERVQVASFAGDAGERL